MQQVDKLGVVELDNDKVEAKRKYDREWRRRSRAEKSRRPSLLAEEADAHDPGEAGDLASISGGVDAVAQQPQPDDGRTGSHGRLDLTEQQAELILVRRRIAEIDLAVRRGELIPLDDAKRQSAALARRIRAALERAPSLLPGDLSPEHQASCKSAMAAAIHQALMIL